MASVSLGTVSFSNSRVATPAGTAWRVRITIEGGVTTPEAFAEAVRALALDQDEPGLGVIFDGAAPVWGYAMLCHKGHKFAWVGTWDPRLQAAVVVQSHWPVVAEGDRLAVNGEQPR